jgi:hypothetical protein
MSIGKSFGNASFGLIAVLMLAACGGGGGRVGGAPAAQPPAPIAISGVVSDGPVTGGSLFVFTASQVVAAMAAAESAADRRARSGDESVLTLARDPADGDRFAFSAA